MASLARALHHSHARPNGPLRPLPPFVLACPHPYLPTCSHFMDALLFSPLTLRGLTLRNRIVLSPMLTYSATNGHTNDTHLAHLAKFAVGGAGLVMVESTKIDPRGCSTPR